jgi:hypothetical protein
MKKSQIANLSFLISALCAFVLFWGFPDLDIAILGIGRHRNFLFHSVVIPMILSITLSSKKESLSSFIKNGIVLGSSISIGIHLIIDVFQPKNVDFIFVRTLIRNTLLDDRIWLGLNGIIGLLIGKKANKYRIENIHDIKRKSKIE